MQGLRSVRRHGPILLGLFAAMFAASCGQPSRLAMRPIDTPPAPVEVAADGVAFHSIPSPWRIAATGWDVCGERSAFERRALQVASGTARYELADPRYPRAAAQEWYGIERAPYQHGITLRRLPACHSGDALTVRLASSLPLRPLAEAEAEDVAGSALPSFEAVDEHGAVAARYRGLQVFDAEAKPVAFALRQTAATELALTLDLAGAAFPLTIDPWIELPGIGAVSLPGPTGEAVAIDDKARWLAVANTPDQAPGLRLFRAGSDGAWTLQQTIAPPRDAAGLRFATQLALAGDALAVAASPRSEGAGTARVYVYAPDASGRWQSRQTLEPADARAGGSVGAVLTGDAAWLAIAWPGREWEADAAVDLLSVSAAGLQPRVRLLGPMHGEPDGFGRALALADGQLFVGAPFAHAGAPLAGRVHVYALDAHGPRLLESLNPPQARLRGRFGSQLAANPRWLVVGGARGVLTVYAREAGTLAWVGNLPLGESQPDALALRGDRLLVRTLPGEAGAGSAPEVHAFDLNSLQTVPTSAEAVDDAGRMPFAEAVAAQAGAKVAGSGHTQASGPPSGPQLSLTVPAENAVLHHRRPDLALAYESQVAIDLDSLRWNIAGQAVALACDPQKPAQPLKGSLTCRPTADLPWGPQTWELSIADRRNQRSAPVLRTVTIGQLTLPPPIPASAASLAPLATGWRITVQASAIAAGAELVVGVQGRATLVAGQRSGSVWVVDVPAQPGDSLLVMARNAAGTSEPLVLTPGLPAPPAEHAPPLDDGGVATSGPGGEFLIAGPDPIQRDADPGAFEVERSAVVRGKVIDRDGGPLPGVRVAVVDRPEYGYTLTRADGQFDLLVNGGGVLLLEFNKAGYLFAQRQAEVPWKDFLVLDDVALVALDAAVTRIQAGAAAPQLAVGSVSEDAAGPRQPAVYFPAGMQAQMVLADGSTAPLAELDVRITEYTVGDNGPEAMPAPLPPTTAYTYAFELSVDQALAQGAKVDGRDVLFDRPVSFYVDNFMEFPVGEAVPTGYYDNTAARWTAVDDGRVIGVLAIADGLAVLDVDGGGLPASAAELAQLGIDDDERRAIAQRFAAGQSFWRVQITHFSTWDCNWPYGLPDDTIQHAVNRTQNNEKKPDEPCVTGCIIGSTTRNLGEHLDAPGIPGRLLYDSARVLADGGDKGPTFQLDLTPAAVPASMKRVELELDFLGSKHRFAYEPRPNLRAKIPLTLIDPYARTREGTYPVKIRVGYVYIPVYYGGNSSGFTRSFGAAGGTVLAGDRVRTEITSWWEDSDTITYLSARRRRETAGWQLSVQHVLDPSSGTILFGDGRTVAPGERPETVRTLAGSAINGSADEGVPAVGLERLRNPRAFVVDARGRLYIADTGNHRVRRVDLDGLIFTVAGTGSAGFGGDGGPALAAQLHSPSALAFDATGRLLIADTGNHRIRRIEADGTMTTLAGTGSPGLAVDGQPADNAPLNAPAGIAANRFGYVFIADTGNKRVWSIQPDGQILRLAGGGSGGGSRARDVALNQPTQLAADTAGNVYIADPGAGRVRLVRPDGFLFTAAGGGSDPAANNVPATQAKLNPVGIALDSAQRLLIADAEGNRVRRVDGNGQIVTVGGSGNPGYTADSLTARRASIGSPWAVGVDRNGRVLFAHGAAVRQIGHRKPEAVDGEITIADPSGETLHVFDEGGLHLRTLDALTGGVLYRLNYDNGVVVRIVDAFGNTSRIERDGAGRPSALISPDGLRSTLGLDARGFLASLTSPEGHSHRFGYSQHGLMQWQRDAREHQSDYTFDADGRLIRDDRPDGSGWVIRAKDYGSGTETEFESRLGRIDTYGVSRRPDGTELRYHRAPDGRETLSETRPTGESITEHADGSTSTSQAQLHPRFGAQALLPASSVLETPTGRRLEIEQGFEAFPYGSPDPAVLTGWRQTTTVNGRESVLHFDKATLSFTATSPSGRTSTTTVDAQRRPVAVRVPGLADLDYSYDQRGRLIAVRQTADGDTREFGFGYDVNGYLASVTDPLDRTVTTERDRDGRPTQLHLPDGRQIGLVPDPKGNLTELATPAGPVHQFGYDPLDRETRYQAPLADGEPTITDTEYDLDGNPTRQTLPGGLIIDFSYDAAGRLKTISRPSQAGDHGNEVQLAYTYDGPLTTAETSTGAVAGQVRYGYDHDLRLNQLTIPGGTIAYAYDPDSLLTRASLQAGTANRELALTRDPANGLLTGTHAGSVSDQWQWNGFGEPKTYEAKAGGNTLYRAEFTRDRLGRITGKTEIVQGVSTTTAYRYDLAGRLDQVSVNGTVVESYSYDLNGNRESLTRGGQTIDYTHDAQDRLLNQGACTYLYTPADSLNTKTCAGTITAYTYTAQGDLTAADLPDGTALEYLIDGRGRRVGKRVNGDLVQAFIYQDQLNPVAELDGNGQVKATFVYADRGHVPSLMHKAGKTYRIVADHLGSVRLVVDIETGAIAQRIDYDAWGNVLVDTNPGFQPFGYAGGIYDRDLGLVRFGARDYDPEIGRWTAKDPIRFAAGQVSLYAYVGGDPINLVDPSGLASLPPPIIPPPPPLNPGPVGLPSVITKVSQQTLASRADNFVASQVVKALTGDALKVAKNGAVVANTVGFGVSLFLYSSDLGCGELDCNKNGFPDYLEEKYKNENICRFAE